MQYVNNQNLKEDVSKYEKNKADNKDDKPNIYLLADKHGLGDVLGRDIPEPKDMDELNEQILTIEVVIRSLRSHVQTQYQRLSRLRLPRGFASILVVFAMSFIFTSGAFSQAANNDTATVHFNESIEIDVLANDNWAGAEFGNLTITSDPTNGSAVINGDNTSPSATITYTNTNPLANSDSFQYRLQVSTGIAPSTQTFDFFGTVNITIQNNLPTVTSISDQTWNEDDADKTIDLTNYFKDIDDATLTYSISNSNISLVTTSVSGGILTIDLLKNQNGTADITITAIDVKDATVADTFTVTVNPVDDAPAVINPIADFTVDEDAEDTVVNLDNYFADVDTGNPLTYTAVKTGNTNIYNHSTTTLNITGNLLTISYNLDKHGIAHIVVTAEDENGATTNDAFDITINSVTDPVTIADGVVDIQEDASNGLFFYSNLMHNPDQLGFTLEKLTDPEIVSISFQAAQTRFRATSPKNFFGEDSFQVRVTDELGNVDDATLTLNVYNTPDSPIAKALSVDVPVNEGATFFLDGFDPDNNNGEILEPVTFSVDASTNTKGMLQLLEAETGEMIYSASSDSIYNESFVYTIASGGESATNTVTLNVKNTAPELVQSFPDFSVDEDADDTIIDLSPYFNETDTGDFITFSASKEGNTNIYTKNATILTITDNLLTISYNADQHGIAHITVSATDRFGGITSDVFDITINSVTDPVTIADGVVDIQEEASNGLFFYSNLVHNPDNLGFTLEKLTDPEIVSINFQTVISRFRATSPKNFFGEDSFQIRVTDELGNVDEATLTLNVYNVQDAPKVFNVEVEMDEDTAAGIILDGTDVDQEPLTFSIVDIPQNGLLDVINGNTVTYTPHENFNGTDMFTYLASDGIEDSATATVTITVTNVNDKPVAQGSNITLDEDTSVDIVLSATDPDELDTLTYSIYTKPRKGYLILDENTGKVTYTPLPDFNGTDDIRFIVNDGTVDSKFATVKITVNPVNDTPSAGVLPYQKQHNIATAANAISELITVDLDGDGVLDALITEENGNEIIWLVNDGTGNFTEEQISDDAQDVRTLYAADLDGDNDTDILAGLYEAGQIVWFENDGLSFSKHVVNDAASNPVSVVSADMDGDGDVDVLSANNGSNEFVWYENMDGKGSFGQPQTIASANNPQSTSAADLDGDGDYDVLTASNGKISWYQNDDGNFTETIVAGVESTAVSASAIDLDFDGDLDVIASEGSSTSICLENLGEGQFTFTSQGTPSNSQVQFVDYDHDGDIDYITIYDIYLFLNENKGNNTFALSILHTSDSQQPIATADIDGDGDQDLYSANTTNGIHNIIWYENGVVGDEDTPLNITLTGTDGDNDPLSFDVLSQPVNGSLTGDVPNLTYLANSNFNGADSFTFKTNDGQSNSEVYTVNIEIDAVNDAPVISTLPNITVDEEAADEVIDLAFYVIDADGGILTYIISNSNPSLLSATLTDSTLTLDFLDDQNGTADIIVSASDGLLEGPSEYFTVTVNAINDAPIANVTDITIHEDSPVEITISATDIEDDEVTLSIVDLPVNGRLEGSVPNFTYYPNIDFEGVDTVTFIASDSELASGTGIISITVEGINDAPSFQLNKTSINVMADAEPQTLTNIVKAISPGSIYETSQNVIFNVTTNNDELFTVLPAISADGTLSFEPMSGTFGNAEVSITLVDDGGTENGGEDTSETQKLFIIVEGPAKLLLLNSAGAGITGATAQYYDGNNWMDLPGETDVNGELELPTELIGSVKFRMVYNNTNQTITQNLDNAKTVLFQTVNVTVELVDSAGAYITSDSGDIEFNRSGWQTFGSTNSQGFAVYEMLPGSYSFRMTYGNSQKTISQAIHTDPVVTFQTKPVYVSLKSSTGADLTGEAEFTFSGVELIAFEGGIENGSIKNELLPGTYRFRVTYENATVELRQNIDQNAIVEFQTKQVSLTLQNSSSALITDGTARYEYNSNGWNEIGVNGNGEISVELLPKTYTFQIEYKSTKKQKSQNITFDSDIAFKTAKFDLELRDCSNATIPNATISGYGIAQYYSGGWNIISNTVDGVASIELLPNVYNFRMSFENSSLDQKNEFIPETVVFQTEPITVELRNSNDDLFTGAIGTVQFNSSGWKDFGSLVEGVATKELFPKVYTFRMNYANATNDKQNDGFNPLLVTFNTSNVLVELIDSAGFLLEDDFSVEYNSGGWQRFGSSNSGQVRMELLPKTYSIRLAYNGKTATQNVSVLDSEEIVDFQTGQVVSLSNNVVQVNSGGWIDFFQNIELLAGNYKFKYVDNHSTTYAIEAGYINEID